MRFSVDPSNFPAILSFIREEAKRLHVPAKAIHKMEIACEEAIVNIFNYALPNSSNSVSVECSLDSECHFKVVIKDEGPPFNPLEVPVDLQNGVDLSERRIGGLGIHLIRKLIDEAVYVREQDSNILHLVLRLECPD